MTLCHSFRPPCPPCTHLWGHINHHGDHMEGGGRSRAPARPPAVSWHHPRCGLSGPAALRRCWHGDPKPGQSPEPGEVAISDSAKSVIGQGARDSRNATQSSLAVGPWPDTPPFAQLKQGYWGPGADLCQTFKRREEQKQEPWNEFSVKLHLLHLKQRSLP